jgi:hypothetical protein
MNSFMLFFSSLIVYAASSLPQKLYPQKDKLYILIGEEAFQINLLENPITNELIFHMPISTEFTQKDSMTILSPFNLKLDENMLPQEPNLSLEANKGDLLLYKGKEFIILNEAQVLNNGGYDYIILGNCENVDNLLDKLDKNMNIILMNNLNYEDHMTKLNTYAKYNIIWNYFTWKVFTFFCFLII